MVYDKLVAKLVGRPEKEMADIILKSIRKEDLIDFDFKEGLVLCLRKGDRDFYIVIQDVTDGG